MSSWTTSTSLRLSDAQMRRLGMLHLVCNYENGCIMYIHKGSWVRVDSRGPVALGTCTSAAKNRCDRVLKGLCFCINTCCRHLKLFLTFLAGSRHLLQPHKLRWNAALKFHIQLQTGRGRTCLIYRFRRKATGGAFAPESRGVSSETTFVRLGSYRWASRAALT